MMWEKEKKILKKKIKEIKSRVREDKAGAENVKGKKIRV